MKQAQCALVSDCFICCELWRSCWMMMRRRRRDWGSVAACASDEIVVCATGCATSTARSL